MANDRILSMLSLARKAGKLKTGETAVDAAGKSGEAYLVILATDASDRTKKSVTDMCAFYEVPYLVYGSKESLGRAVGKEYLAQAAVTDENFAQGVLKLAAAQEV